MIKCPNSDCGYENVDGTQFCEGCGEELPQAGAAAASAPAAAASGDMIKCPACDNLNPSDNLVCEVCGSDLHPAGGGAAGGGAAGDAVGGTSAAPGAAPAMTPMPSAAAVATPDPDTNTTAAAMGAPNAPGSDPNAATSAPAGSGTAVPPASFTIDAGDTLSGGAVPVTAPDAVAGDSSDDAGALPVVAAAPANSGVVPVVPGADLATTALGDLAGADNDVAPSTASMGVATPSASTNPQVDTAAPVAGAASGGSLEPGRVKLTVEQGMTVGKQFILGDPEILVGREDADEEIYPDIDLSDQDEGYVHRKHATLQFANGGLSVTHLGGANKTRINNRPLPDNEPQPVKMGDKIAFGKVVMRVGAN
jgi:hypothetical protein